MTNTQEMLSTVKETLHLTDEELARSIGVSIWTIFRWRRGVTEPRGLHKRALEMFVNKLVMEANK